MIDLEIRELTSTLDTVRSSSISPAMTQALFDLWTSIESGRFRLVETALRPGADPSNEDGE